MAAWPACPDRLGSAQAAQLIAAGTVPTNNDNETLSFSMMGSGVMVTSYADEAMVVKANIPACDSIVHVVDHVLLPNFAAEGLVRPLTLQPMQLLYVCCCKCFAALALSLLPLPSHMVPMLTASVWCAVCQPLDNTSTVRRRLARHAVTALHGSPSHCAAPSHRLQALLTGCT